MSMKKPSKDKKRIAAAAIAIVLALLMLLGSLAPFIYASNDASAVEITAELGLSGFYKVGMRTPVKVVLTNNGSGFTGEVNIKTNVGESSSKKYAIHSYPIELPENSSKVVTMDVTINNLSYLQDQLKILVEDSNGNVLAEKNLAARALDPNKVTAAVLTDTENSLNYVKNMNFDQWTTDQLKENLAYLDEQTFPENPEHLKVFDILFISNYDTGRLSEAHTAAISAWVRSGGFLVLGTGTGYDKVMKGLGSLVDISWLEATSGYAFQPLTESASDKETLEANGETAQEEAAEPETEIEAALIDLSRFEVADGYTYLDGADTPLISITALGTGKIAAAAFDFSVAPATENSALQSFMEDVLRTEFNTVQGYNDTGDYYYYRSSYKYSNLPSLNTGMIIIIFILIVLYIAIIGPILYFILKKRDKREMGFLIIPCAAVVLTLVIYGLSYNTVYKKPILNTFGYIDIYNGDTTVNYTNKTGAMISQKGDIDVDIDDIPSLPEVEYNNWHNYYGYNTYSSPAEDVYKITYGDGQKITYLNAASWDTNVFSYRGEADLGGSLVMELESNNGIVNGVIHNTTDMDFEDIIIGSGYSFSNFGNLEAGASLEFILDKQLLSSANYYFNSYDVLQNGYYGDEGYREAELKRTILDEKFEMDNQADYYGAYTAYSSYSSSFSVSSIGRASGVLRTSSPMGSAIQDNYKITLYAFSKDKFGDAKIMINKKTPIEFNLNVFSMSVPYDIIGADRFQIDYGVVGLSEVVSNYYHYYYEDTIEIVDAGDYELYYYFPEHERVEAFCFKYPSKMSGTIPKFTIYNNATEEWETLSYLDYADDAQQYFDAEGRIKINMEALGDARLSPPQFKVEGGERIG